jgi:hypothetical protein
MKATDIALYVFQIGSPVLIAVLTWVSTKLAQLIHARVKNEYLRGVLLRLDDAVLSVVREIHQVTVEALKAAAPDGKLTPEAKVMVKRAALDAIKKNLGARGLTQLTRVLGIDGEAVDKLIGTRVEAAVHDLKYARTLNGVSKGGEPYPFAA